MNRILIADDEPLARARLRALLESMDRAQVVAEAAHGQAVLEQLESHPEINTVLLDIRMPGMDGMETAARLRTCFPHLVILFTTAYPDHALEAYQHQAVAYLLKPVDRASLAKAMEQVHRIHTGRKALEQREQQFLTAHIRGRLVRVPLEEIPYLQASQKYIQFNWQQHEILLEDSLVKIEQRHPGVFLRIHRNALVNPRFIEGIERDAEGHHWLLLRGRKEKLEISRRNLPAVRQFVLGQ